jgi:hypothetical protein
LFKINNSQHVCNLTASGSTSTELYNKLYNDLENIHQWLLASKLTLNTSKTEYMIVGSRQRLGKIDDEAELNWEIIK